MVLVLAKCPRERANGYSCDGTRSAVPKVAHIAALA